MNKSVKASPFLSITKLNDSELQMISGGEQSNTEDQFVIEFFDPYTLLGMSFASYQYIRHVDSARYIPIFPGQGRYLLEFSIMLLTGYVAGRIVKGIVGAIMISVDLLKKNLTNW